jgi:hypothetical protein
MSEGLCPSQHKVTKQNIKELTQTREGDRCKYPRNLVEGRDRRQAELCKKGLNRVIMGKDIKTV